MSTKRHIWIKLGILVLAVRILFSFFPDMAQTVYQRGLFQVFRVAWDYTFGLLPFPIIYLLFAGLLIWLWRKWRMSKKVWSWRKLPLRLLSILAFVFFWFQVLWGYNYQCPEIFGGADREVATTDLPSIEELCFQAAVIAEARRASFDQVIRPNETELRSLVESSVAQFGYPVLGNVRCRVVSQHGVLRRLGILGIYFPFVGEGHADGSQIDLTLPFTVAHEMSHGYGVTHEGEANFIAWHALYHSDDPDVAYIADLQLLRSCLIQWKWSDPKGYALFRAGLDERIVADLDAINDNMRQHPLYFPVVAETVNDVYLKTQGVEAGVESYDEFVVWCFQYIHNLD